MVVLLFHYLMLVLPLISKWCRKHHDANAYYRVSNAYRKKVAFEEYYQREFHDNIYWDGNTEVIFLNCLLSFIIHKCNTLHTLYRCQTTKTWYTETQQKTTEQQADVGKQARTSLHTEHVCCSTLYIPYPSLLVCD